MKKLFFILLLCLFLTACKEIKSNRINELNKIKINELYTYKDYFKVENNQLLINSLYFDNENKLITKDLTASLLENLKNEENMPIFYINNNKSIKEIKNIFNLSTAIYNHKVEKNEQSFKISLADLIINENQDVSLNFNRKLVLKIIFEQEECLYYLNFNFFTPKKDNIENVYIKNGIECEMLSYKNDKNTKGLFILPALDDTIIHYQIVAKKFIEQFENYNIHILNYPGFGNSTNMYLSNIIDLSNWLKDVILNFEYEKISLLGSKEGALLLRHFSHTESIYQKISFEYLIVINPISELGLGYYDDNKKPYKNINTFSLNDEISTLNYEIVLKNYQKIIAKTKQLKAKFSNIDYLFIVKYSLNKKNYLQKKYIFNNINLSNYKIDNGYLNYGDGKNSEYIFKKAIIDKRKFIEVNPNFKEKLNYLQFIKDENGTFYIMDKYQLGINYIMEKKYFNNCPHHFFNNYTYNMADFFFYNDENINELNDIFQNIKTKQRIPSKYLKPIDLYNVFLLYELSDKFTKISQAYFQFDITNILTPSEQDIKSLLNGIIKYFIDKYNNDENIYQYLPTPYTYLDKYMNFLSKTKTEKFKESLTKLKNYQGFDLINIIESELLYDEKFLYFNHGY